MPIKEDLIYTAGIVDGEGSIQIDKCIRTDRKMRNPSYSLYLCVYNTNIRLGEFLYSKFGGSIYHGKSKNPKHKDSHDWNLYGSRAKELLIGILPYLKLKNEQCKIGISFQDEMNANGGHGKITVDSLIIRERLYTEMRKLNKKGRK